MMRPAPATGPQPEPERIVASLRPHGRAVFWPSVLLIAIAFGVAYGAGLVVEQWQLIAVIAVGVVLAVILWLLPLLRWLSRRYVITTRRVLVSHGLFVRTRRDAWHGRGYDIEMREGAMQRMLRTGDLTLTAGDDRPIVLHDVPAASLVRAALHDLEERERRGRDAWGGGDRSSSDNQADIW